MLIGLPGADESEGFDRTHMNLPANQLARPAGGGGGQPERRRRAGQRLHRRPRRRHAARARRWSRPGSAARPPAAAIADVLTGTVNPSGRLAETIPHRLRGQLAPTSTSPGDSQVVRYGEGLFIGYRGYDATHTDVAFPFGFGLSYTTFALSDLDVATSGSVADGDLAATVTVTVTNTGTGRRRRGRPGLRPRRRGLASPGRCAS